MKKVATEEKKEKKREKRGKKLMIIVATTSLPAVDRPNADRWNAALVPIFTLGFKMDHLLGEDETIPSSTVALRLI